MDCAEAIKDGRKVLPERHVAHGWLISPTGRRITPMCPICAQVCIDEYATKLGEQWTYENVPETYYEPRGRRVSA